MDRAYLLLGIPELTVQLHSSFRSFKIGGDVSNWCSYINQWIIIQIILSTIAIHNKMETQSRGENELTR